MGSSIPRTYYQPGQGQRHPRMTSVLHCTPKPSTADHALWVWCRYEPLIEPVNVGDIGLKSRLVALCLPGICIDCWIELGGRPGRSMPPDRPRQPHRPSFCALTDTFSSFCTNRCSCGLSHVLETDQRYPRTNGEIRLGLHRFQLPKTRIGLR